MNNSESHNLNAEGRILASIICNNDLFLKLPMQAENLFFSRQNQKIYQAMQKLHQRQVPLQEDAILDEMAGDRTVNLKYLNHFLQEFMFELLPVHSEKNFLWYLNKLLVCAEKRSALEMADEIQKSIAEGKTTKEAFARARERKVEFQTEKGAVPIGPLVDQVFQKMEDIYLGKVVDNGLYLGIETLDKRFQGLKPGKFIVIGGRPAMGKTALGITFVKDAVMHNHSKNILVFSIEMTNEELVKRLLSAETRIDSKRLDNPTCLKAEEFDRLSLAQARLMKTKLFFEDLEGHRVTPDYIRNRIKAHETKSGKIDLVLIDYLQLMKSDSKYQNSEDEVRQISRNLKLIAREFKLPLICLAQLNRELESRNDKRPFMSDLRYSGAIEQDADIVMFIYRDEVYDPETKDQGIAEILIRKNRDGEIGTVKMAFFPQYTRFEDL